MTVKSHWMKAARALLALTALAASFSLLSCGGGETKKEAPPPVVSEAAPPPMKGEAPAKPANDALEYPVATMPPPPGERTEKDLIAEADRRSESLKPMIQQQIAAVVPGPYPETKEKKVELIAVVRNADAKPKEPPRPAKPEPTHVAEAKAPAPAVAPVAVPVPVPVVVPAPVPVAPPPAAPKPQRAAPPPLAEPVAPPPAPHLAQVKSNEPATIPDLVLEKKFTVADGLPSNLISALYVDETEAWVGTAGGGVARYVFSESNWLTTATVGGLASDFVTDVVKFKGKVYVGTKKGISIYDGFDWTTIQEVDPVTLHNVTFTTKDGELWVAARNMRGGLLSYDGAKWTDRSTMRQGLILNNVSDIVFDGSDLWLGTTSRGVYVRRGKEWLIFSVTDGIASNFIYTMAVKSGKAYLGGCCGVSHFDGDRWSIYDVPEGLPHSTVNDIAWDEDGIVWMGSKNGLAAFDGSTFKTFTSEDGLLPDNHVTSVYSRGNELWIGTVGGLARVQKSR